MDQFRWRSILPSLESRVLDSLLDNGTLKLSFQVKQTSLNTNTIDEEEEEKKKEGDITKTITTPSPLNKSQSTLYDIVRTIPDLNQLIGFLPDQHQVDLVKLTELSTQLDTTVDNDNKLTEAFEIAVQILDGLTQSPSSSSEEPCLDYCPSPLLLNFFKQDYDAAKRSNRLSKAASVITTTSTKTSGTTWKSKLMRSISQKNRNSLLPLPMSRSASEPDTTPSDSQLPPLQRSFTVAERGTLLQRVTKRTNSKTTSVPPKPRSTQSTTTVPPSGNLLTRLGSYRWNPTSQEDQEEGVVSHPTTSRPRSRPHSNSPRPRSITKSPPKPQIEKRPSLLRTTTLKSKLTRQKSQKSVKHSTDTSNAIEITISFHDHQTNSLKLTVSSDITYDRLLRGLRNKAILTGITLPPLECLTLSYFRNTATIPLCTKNLKDFFDSPEVEKLVVVNIDLRHSPANRVSWLDLTSPGLASPTSSQLHRHSRQLSSAYSGLDLEPPSSTTLLRGSPLVRTPSVLSVEKSNPFQFTPSNQLSSIEDYLRTPVKQEVKNIMKDSLWDVMPQLQFSVSSNDSSIASSPRQLSPKLESSGVSILNDSTVRSSKISSKHISLDGKSIANESILPSDHELYQPDLEFHPTSPHGKSNLTRQNSTFSARLIDGTTNLPRRLFRLTSRPSLLRQKTAPLPQRTKTFSTPPPRKPQPLDMADLMRQPHRRPTQDTRLKVSIAINKDFVVKLELDTRTATYTSLYNRMATKFTRGGYPLAQLNNLALVHAHFPNADPTTTSPSSSTTTIIDDTPTLHRILHSTASRHLTNTTTTTTTPRPVLPLLLVPRSLLTESPSQARGGIRWDSPPNLSKLTSAVRPIPA